MSENTTINTLEEKELESSGQKMPEHIGIIMDGNRRWAKKNKMKIILGHRKGAEAFENILRFLGENKVKVLTVYAFSTENWRRDKEQVQDLLTVMSESLLDKADDLMKNNVVFRAIGKIDDFPEKIKSGLKELIERTKNNTGIILNVALSYGGRDEIIRAVNKLIKKGDEVTEEEFGKCLDTGDIKDPELIIRTGGAQRLSNFLLWQGNYSELFFTPTLWPDFNVDELKGIIREYNQRIRNFGK